MLVSGISWCCTSPWGWSDCCFGKMQVNRSCRRPTSNQYKKVHHMELGQQQSQRMCGSKESSAAPWTSSPICITIMTQPHNPPSPGARPVTWHTSSSWSSPPSPPGSGDHEQGPRAPRASGDTGEASDSAPAAVRPELAKWVWPHWNGQYGLGNTEVQPGQGHHLWAEMERQEREKEQPGLVTSDWNESRVLSTWTQKTFCVGAYKAQT